MITDEQQNEIEIARNDFSKTLRPCSPALEEILFTVMPVLDHGFVRVVDYMGDETSIVQAARVSYGLGTKKAKEDEDLLRYLMRHRHDTPYEMCEIKYHVKLPIFVARQWIRHRSASVNEYSARYSILDKEFYIPETENLAIKSKSNRQGRSNVLDKEQANKVLNLLREDSKLTYSHYEEMIDPDGINLSRELARINLTLNTYTQWYWKCNLRNLLHFLNLRSDSHAQFEIRAYAEVMLETVQSWTPSVYEAFLDYKKEAVTFSQMEMLIIHSANRSGLSINQWLDKERAIHSSVDEFIRAHHLTKREYNEFLEKIG